MPPKIISADEAIRLIPNKTTLCIGGGFAGPEHLLEQLGAAFRERGAPNQLTIFHPGGFGDNNQRGLNHLAHVGLAKRVIAGFWGKIPKMVELARNEDFEAYTFPQGVLTQLLRATAAGLPGLLTKTGLYTFVDPRLEGGRLNSISRDKLVELVLVSEQMYLLYRSIPFQHAFIRGTAIDKRGNLTMEDEPATFSTLSMAQAAKAQRGTVIAQVRTVRENAGAKPGLVKVPGAFIDYVVVVPEQGMTLLTENDPALIDREEPVRESFALDGLKKVIARRAAMEIQPGMFLHAGCGLPDGVPTVLRNEGALSQVTFLSEVGVLGGMPAAGLNFGAMYNPHAILDNAAQFDFIHGGGLDMAFIGFAEIDQHGNVNASKFADRLLGCGSYIDFSQHTRKAVFCGEFARGADISVNEDGLEIRHPGSEQKFVQEVEQITFSGHYALDRRQPVLFVTERAVFELTKEGLVLKEVAPGVDVREHILALMDFQPIVPPYVPLMSQKCFTNALLFKPQ